MNNGNCVDKFVKNRLDSHLDNLMKIRNSIQDRIIIRSIIPDYFNDVCYESDFADIRKIKEESYKLIENCNKFLERISEQYSKLS